MLVLDVILLALVLALLQCFFDGSINILLLIVGSFRCHEHQTIELGQSPE